MALETRRVLFNKLSATVCAVHPQPDGMDLCVTSQFNNHTQQHKEQCQHWFGTNRHILVDQR